MPYYDYTVSDLHGRSSKGSRNAADPKQLAALLSAEGLFLVSCHVAPTAPPAAPPQSTAPPPTEHLLTDADKLSPMARRIERLRTFLCTPKGLAVLGSILVICMIGDYAYLSQMRNNPFHTPPPRPMTEDERVVADIKPGLQRGDVERRLTTRAESATTDQTSYMLDATTRVLVFYDATGGPWSPQNRVLRRAQLLRIIPR